jgi:hypothetical protein
MFSNFFLRRSYSFNSFSNLLSLTFLFAIDDFSLCDKILLINSSFEGPLSSLMKE